MRKDYKRVMQKRFASVFLKSHPEFHIQKSEAPYFTSAEQVFATKQRGQAFFIILSPHGNGHEAFTIEAGWSRTGEQPRLSMRPSLGNPRDDSILAREEYVTRLAYLDDQVPEFWYVEEVASLSQADLLQKLIESSKPLSADIAEARVIQHVTEALAATERVGIPFLERAGLSTGA